VFGGVTGRGSVAIERISVTDQEIDAEHDGATPRLGAPSLSHGGLKSTVQSGRLRR
jgi:hypothetical protein